MLTGNYKNEVKRPLFRPFTRESLVALEARIAESARKKLEKEQRQAGDKYLSHHYEEELMPDETLEQGVLLPPPLEREFPSELIGVPIEDIDNYYEKVGIPTFVVISKSKDIFRFSGTKALFLLDPFNPLRRVAIYMLVHQWFSFLVIVTILTNCILMTMQSTDTIERTEIIFTTIYTFESCLKVTARGFIITNFSYLRDPWNWLDFVVIVLAYLTMIFEDLGNLSALRTFRVLRALKTVAIISGLKTIIGALIETAKNLKDVTILTCFSLSIFALLGLQIYMGVLTQKCVFKGPSNMTHEEWFNWCNKSEHWAKDREGKPLLCSNNSGATLCDENSTCIQGFGANPDYGFTNYDTFPWALLNAFRLLTQDFWESLYHKILRATSPWHIFYFIAAIFLGSIYIVNLILAIVATSYDDLQKKIVDEEVAAAAEKTAYHYDQLRHCDTLYGLNEPFEMMSPFCEYNNSDCEDDDQMCLKPCQREKIKTCPSLPDSLLEDKKRSQESLTSNAHWSPSCKRYSNFKPLILPACLDAQEQLPFMDDSNATTPDSDVVRNNYHSRHSSYTSHTSRISYTSHGDERCINWSNKILYKPRQGLQPQKTLPSSEYRLSVSSHKRSKENPFLVPKQISKHTTVNTNDVMILSDNIDQTVGRQNRIIEKDKLEKEAEKPSLKQSLTSFCLKSIDVLCVWDCCWCWIRIQELFALIVFDPFMELFITLCIVVNTCFMAMDHYDMDKDLEDILRKGNYFFTGTFAFEAFMKLIAINPKFYFREGWNVFDFFIVALSLIEIGLDGVRGLSVLRSFRLLRVFKLAKSWPTLNLLITIMGKTLGDLANLTFILGILIFIFAVMGMQLFGSNYAKKAHEFKNGTLPRWNFTDFMHSFMLVFRILCGEWIETMWDCMKVSGLVCVPFFISTVVIVHIVMLNLFLALLLSSFGASNLSSPTSESADTKKLQEAFDRFARAHRWLKNRIFILFKRFRNKPSNLNVLKKSKELPCDLENGQVMRKEEPKSIKSQPIQSDFVVNDRHEGHDSKAIFKNKAIEVLHTIQITQAIKSTKQDSLITSLKPSIVNNDLTSQSKPINYMHSCLMLDGSSKTMAAPKSIIKPTYYGNLEICEKLEESKYFDDIKSEDIISNGYPEDCLSDYWYVKFPCCLKDTPFWSKWRTIRSKCFKIVEDKYFEILMIALILLSSLTLALEDVNLKERPWLEHSLIYIDKSFTILFFLEMLLKWIAYGFKSYFSNAWCWLDFVIVMVSMINFVVGLLNLSNIPALKTMRTLKALRPLRAMSKLQWMRVSAINLGADFAGMTKIQAFKTMRTLRALRPLRALSRMQGMRVVVNALVQAIPAIFNVLLVCLIFWLVFAIMGVQLFAGKFSYCRVKATKEMCNSEEVQNKTVCLSHNDTLEWFTPMLNFDHVLNGYLSLFQVATFKGWTIIMNHAVDARDIDLQPSYEYNIYNYLYFVSFILFGSFFTLNLFIGVIIDNFNEQKKRGGGSREMLMTEDQKKYLNALKKMGIKKPMKAIPRPRFKLQATIFDITTNKKFDMIIMLLIMLNMFIMSLDQYQASRRVENILESCNLFFIAVFTAECLLKIFALRIHYFREPWNVFDFIVVILSIATSALKDFVSEYFVSPTLLRVVRVVKIGRVLRLVKSAKGIRTLLFALAMSLPALFNICLLLFLVMFIYAIFGMSFFMNVKHRYELDETFNFGTFLKSFLLLFQMCTSAGWDGVLAAIMDETECDKTSEFSDCGNKKIAIFYLLSYLIISSLVIINMYIAVILENYSQAAEDVNEGLTDDDYNMYYEIWQKFDPNGTQFIHWSKLSDFLDTLEEPLHIPKPNRFKIVDLNIPICVKDMVYCVDILNILTKDFFARKGNSIEEMPDIEFALPLARKFEHVSSTLKKQREEYCARVIQKAWRNYKGVFRKE